MTSVSSFAIIIFLHWVLNQAELSVYSSSRGLIHFIIEQFCILVCTNLRAIFYRYQMKVDIIESCLDYLAIILNSRIEVIVIYYYFL